MFVLGRSPSPLTLTNLVPCLWKEDHLGLTHDWCTCILFKTCFIFICLSTCPYILMYNYIYIHVYLLLDQPIPAGIEVHHKRTTFAIRLGLYEESPMNT